ncbi:MAG: hypothetical protein ACI8UC_002145, partial [Psychromonas sp.]
NNGKDYIIAKNRSLQSWLSLRWDESSLPYR